MGPVPSRLEKALAQSFPEHERFYGLENFGNTCYCNSVLQALYFCPPFRQRLQQHAYTRSTKVNPKEPEEKNLLTCLADLFMTISQQRRRAGVYAPRKFVDQLRKENELFNNLQHQDAHEFLNYLLNTIAELLHEEQKMEARKKIRSKSLGVPEGPLYTPSQSMSSGLSRQSIFGSISRKVSNSGSNSSDNNKYNSNTNNNNNNSNSNGNSNTNKTYPSKLHKTQSENITSRNRTHVNNNSKNSNTTDRNRNNSNNLNGNSSNSEKAVENGGEDDDQNHDRSSEGVNPAATDRSPIKTWIQEIFEGVLTNETKCLCCETVSHKDESFLDLSVDIEQNSSITQCLRSFSSTEMLQGEHKYFCEACCSLQEAEKRMRIKKLPPVLALHLKRFKYIEQQQRFKKLSYKVVFPIELKLFNTCEDSENPDQIYDLFAVVIHVGSQPNHGHYISIVKSYDCWLLFDDEAFQIISEKSIQSFFGLSHDQGNQDSESGYILFYQTRHTPLAETSQAYSNTADDDDGDDDTQSNAKDSNDAAAADKNNIPLGGIPSEDELEVAFTNGKLTSINNKPVCSDSTANSNGNTHAYHGTHV